VKIGIKPSRRPSHVSVVFMSVIIDPSMMDVTDLPDPDDASAIFEFAMTFNGYEYFGSFDASADAAASGDRSSLELIRNELFFAARASRHGDDDRFVDVYRQLLPLYLEWVSTRN
jgi:hypothetical protein